MNRQMSRWCMVALALWWAVGAQAAPICAGNCVITGGAVDVGARGAGNGSLSASGGEVLATGGSSFIGALGRDSGTVTLRGAGTRFAVGGVSGSILFVGSDGGTGSITVSDRAQVTVDAFGNGTGFGDSRLFLGSGGTGVMRVESGASLVVRDTGPFGADDGLQIGRSTVVGCAGTGHLSIDGAGSLVQVLGNLGFANIGQANTTNSAVQPGVGRVDVTGGARLVIDGTTDWGYLTLGRGDASDGRLLVQGAGSRVDVSGVGAQVFLGHNFQATTFAGTARGFAHVTDGGVLAVTRTTASGLADLILGAGLGHGELLVDRGGRVEATRIIVSSTGPTSAHSGRLIVNDSGVVQAARVQVGDVNGPVGNGVLGGTGTVIGSVLVLPGGVIEPGNSPGTLTIDGDLRFSGGRLHLEVAGRTPGLFDRLRVLGQIDLTGALVEFDFIDGFLPVAGDTFDFIGAGSVVGLAQAQWRFSGLAPGFLFEVGSGASGGLRFAALNNGIAAVALPPTALLLALAMPLMALNRRRRVIAR